MNVDTLWKLGAGVAVAAAVAGIAFVDYRSRDDSDLAAGASADAAMAAVSPETPGCAGIGNMPDFNECIKGKTRRQLIQDLGQPADVTQGDMGIEIWRYSKWQMKVTDQNGLQVGANLYFGSGNDGVVQSVEFLT